MSGYRRTRKETSEAGTVTYTYLYQNGKVVRQVWGASDNVIDFIYDSNGRPYAMVYNGTTYYYVLNQQGDVIRVLGADGTSYASYTYDAWGRLVYAAGSLKSVNPLRYRGYYYDNDIKMYYLGSRFYDPATKRFINADGQLSIQHTLVGYNMYTYCLNNPVNMVDVGGESPFGALNLADYGAIHAGVQLDLSIRYGWEVEIYVKGPNGRGYLDLYDSTNHEFYEVKSAGVAESGSTERQMEKYKESVISDRTGRESLGSPTPGTQRVSGYYQYGIWDISYESHESIAGLIVYRYELNYQRAFALYGVTLVAAIIAVASNGAALPALAPLWSGYVYSFA